MAHTSARPVAADGIAQQATRVKNTNAAGSALALALWNSSGGEPPAQPLNTRTYPNATPSSLQHSQPSRSRFDSWSSRLQVVTSHTTHDDDNADLDDLLTPSSLDSGPSWDLSSPLQPGSSKVTSPLAPLATESTKAPVVKLLAAAPTPLASEPLPNFGSMALVRREGTAVMALTPRARSDSNGSSTSTTSSASSELVIPMRPYRALIPPPLNHDGHTLTSSPATSAFPPIIIREATVDPSREERPTSLELTLHPKRASLHHQLSSSADTQQIARGQDQDLLSLLVAQRKDSAMARLASSSDAGNDVADDNESIPPRRVLSIEPNTLDSSIRMDLVLASTSKKAVAEEIQETNNLLVATRAPKHAYEQDSLVSNSILASSLILRKRSSCELNDPDVDDQSGLKKAILPALDTDSANIAMAFTRRPSMDLQLQAMSAISSDAADRGTVVARISSSEHLILNHSQSIVALSSSRQDPTHHRVASLVLNERGLVPFGPSAEQSGLSSNAMVRRPSDRDGDMDRVLVTANHTEVVPYPRSSERSTDARALAAAKDRSQIINPSGDGRPIVRRPATHVGASAPAIERSYTDPSVLSSSLITTAQNEANVPVAVTRSKSLSHISDVQALEQASSQSQTISAELTTSPASLEIEKIQSLVPSSTANNTVNSQIMSPPLITPPSNLSLTAPFPSSDQVVAQRKQSADRTVGIAQEASKEAIGATRTERRISTLASKAPRRLSIAVPAPPILNTVLSSPASSEATLPGVPTTIEQRLPRPSTNVTKPDTSIKPKAIKSSSRPVKQESTLVPLPPTPSVLAAPPPTPQSELGLSKVVHRTVARSTAGVTLEPTKDATGLAATSDTLKVPGTYAPPPSVLSPSPLSQPVLPSSPAPRFIEEHSATRSPSREVILVPPSGHSGRHGKVRAIESSQSLKTPPDPHASSETLAAVPITSSRAVAPQEKRKASERKTKEASHPPISSSNRHGKPRNFCILFSYAVLKRNFFLFFHWKNVKP